MTGHPDRPYALQDGLAQMLPAEFTDGASSPTTMTPARKVFWLAILYGAILSTFSIVGHASRWPVFIEPTIGLLVTTYLSFGDDRLSRRLRLFFVGTLSLVLVYCADLLMMSWPRTTLLPGPKETLYLAIYFFGLFGLSAALLAPVRWYTGTVRLVPLPSMTCPVSVRAMFALITTIAAGCALLRFGMLGMGETVAWYNPLGFVTGVTLAVSGGAFAAFAPSIRWRFGGLVSVLAGLAVWHAAMAFPDLGIYPLSVIWRSTAYSFAASLVAYLAPLLFVRHWGYRFCRAPLDSTQSAPESPV